MTNRSQLLEEAFEAQTSLMHIWKLHFGSVLQQEGITFAQMGILMLLSERQPLMGKELAEHFGQTPSSITQTVEGLAQAALVVRVQNVSDRRIVYLRLSKAGEQLVDRLKDKRKELFFKSTETLTDSELEVNLAFQQKSLERLRQYLHTTQE